MNKDDSITLADSKLKEMKNNNNLELNELNVNSKEKNCVVIEKQSRPEVKFDKIDEIDSRNKNEKSFHVKKTNPEEMSKPNINGSRRAKTVHIKKYVTKKTPGVFKKLNIEDIPEKMKRIIEANRKEERNNIFKNLKNYFLNNKESYTKKNKSPKTTLSNYNKYEIKNDLRKSQSQRKLNILLIKKSISQEIRLYKNKNQKSKVQFCHGDSLAGLNDNGSVKTNQDRYIIKQNINDIENYNLFGVLDGHGNDGHLVSEFCKETIYNKLKNHPLLQKKDINLLYHELKKENYKLIESIIIETDKELNNQKFDFNDSGTTCVIIIQVGEHLICANIGDSRAILIKNDKVILLSTDCKPDIPNEYKRITKCGGIIQCEVSDSGKVLGPLRVYEKEKGYPGLAMSRSLGDGNSKRLGVISNPLFFEYRINNDVKYILVCSDGVWEFISNEQAMKICEKYYQSKDVIGLCKELINVSRENWKNNHIMSDDITVIAVFY